MSRAWKAALAILTTAILFYIVTPRLIPKLLWATLIMIIPTYAISLSFSRKMPTHRRWGIAYLVFAGLSYFVAGVFGLNPTLDLISASAWHSLISPYPLLVLLRGCIYSYPCNIYRLTYTIFPISDDEVMSLSITVTIVSLIAIVAAFAMAKNRRWAYGVWLVLVGLSILEALSYVVAQFAKWGMPQYQGPNDPTQTILSLCWSASYLVGFLMARKGADLREVSAS